MKLHGEIDLHSNNNVTVLIDEQDQVVLSKAAAQRSALDRTAAVGLSGCLQGIVVESTFQLVLAS
jgi:hypothetical protein